MHNHTYDNVVEAQQGLIEDGYTEGFIWVDESFMKSDRSKAYTPSDLVIDEHYRFEGMTNPGDMSIVFALSANDGVKGYAISGYGPTADAKFVSFLDSVPQREDPAVEPRP